MYQTAACVRTGLMCAPRLMQAPLRLLACCHEGTHCCLMFVLVSTKRVFAKVHSRGLAQHTIPGVIPPQGQDFALFLELQEIPVGSFLQLGRAREALSNSSTSIWCTRHSS